MASPSFLAKLTQVDRRLIYFLMTIAIAGPMFSTLALPVRIS